MSQFKIHFDTSENIKKHKIKNVKLMITSPPYWDLKNYEAKNQIGYNEDYETYLKSKKFGKILLMLSKKMA